MKMLSLTRGDVLEDGQFTFSLCVPSLECKSCEEDRSEMYAKISGISLQFPTTAIITYSETHRYACFSLLGFGFSIFYQKGF